MTQSLTFLVATDVHLGHKESHPVRKYDSFQAFQEVMDIATQKKVDFLLLGGDLFDQLNPSTESFFLCLNILKKYTFGKKQITIEVTYDGQPYPTNFTSGNVNISLPVFTIHGNHDYPSSQFDKLSACDLLQASNYVNYFGKQLNLHSFTIKPIVIKKKGLSRKIALYGLGYIKDTILNELFSEEKAKFQKPQGKLSEYLTIFIVHQNRYKKAGNKGVQYVNAFSPKNIPEWIDLTIWGHQHQSIPKIQQEFQRPIFQPGSTVLTSFIEAEALIKHCALIQVGQQNEKFSFNPIPLEKSYRPLFCQSLEIKYLKQEFGDFLKLEEFLQERISAILKESSDKYGEKKPIIRLKVETTGYTQIIRPEIIEKKFASFVANGEKILVIWKRKQQKPILISSDQLLNNIKQKKQIAVLASTGINEKMDERVRQNLGNINLTFFSKSFLVDLTSTFTKTSSSSIGAVFKKSVGEEAFRKAKEKQKKLKQMNNIKGIEFKKRMKYEFEKKKFLQNGVVPPQYKGDSEYFLKTEETLMNSHKFQTYCKIMEETVDRPLPDSQTNQMKQQEDGLFIPPNPSSRQAPIINRPASTKSVHNERSLSKDCCEKAMDQKIQQDQIQLSFFEAEKKMESTSRQNLKRDGSQKLSKNEGRVEKKGKNVRFSNDFF